jgi:hypothetical protein
MAVGGYGPVQYSALLPQALELRPRTVIVGFYFGNDLADAYRMAYSHASWKHLRDPPFSAPAVEPDAEELNVALQAGLEDGRSAYKLRTWFRRTSLTYAALSDLTRAARERVGLAPTEEERLRDLATYAQRHSDVAHYVDDPGIETLLSPAYRLWAVSLSDHRTAEGWRITMEVFRDMARRCRSSRVRLVVLAIPTKEMVYLEALRLRQQPALPNFLQYELKERQLESGVRSFCIEEKLDCVFALPAMSAALSNGQALYPRSNNGHPVAAGYEVIANVLARHLAGHAP